MSQEIDVEKEMNKITVCACLGPQFGEPFCPCEMRRKALPRSAEQKEYYSDANVEKRQQKLDLFINDSKERRRNRYLKSCLIELSYVEFSEHPLYDLTVPFEDRNSNANIDLRYDSQPLLIAPILNNGKHSLLIWLDQKDTLLDHIKTDIYLLVVFPEKELFTLFLDKVDKVKNSVSQFQDQNLILNLLVNFMDQNILEYYMQHKTVFSEVIPKESWLAENTVKLYTIEKKDVIHWILYRLKNGINVDKIGSF